MNLELPASTSRYGRGWRLVKFQHDVPHSASTQLSALRRRRHDARSGSPLVRLDMRRARCVRDIERPSSGAHAGCLEIRATSTPEHPRIFASSSIEANLVRWPCGTTPASRYDNAHPKGLVCRVKSRHSSPGYPRICRWIVDHREVVDRDRWSVVVNQGWPAGA